MWFVDAVGYFYCTVLLHACSFCALVKLYNVTARRRVRASAIEERAPPAQYNIWQYSSFFSEVRDFLFHNQLRK